MKKKTTSRFQWRILAACSLFSSFFVGYIFGLLSQNWMNDKPVLYSSSNPLFISLGAPYDFVRSYNDSNKTVKTDTKRKIQKFLMVGILTGPSNYMRRNYIRKSWLSLPNLSDVHHVFVIGGGQLSNKDRLQLEIENKAFNDILLLDNVLDSYRNLTFKLLQFMIWLDKNTNFSYLLKVDDDSFARVDKLNTILKSRSQTGRLYWGYFDGRARVKHYGKWAEKSWVLCDRYLPYAKGGGYVLSQDLVHFVARNSDVLQLYNSEDVSVGAWLAPLNITRFHSVEFDTEYESRGCLNSFLVTHKQTMQDMLKKYQNLVKNGQMCNPEVVTKNSYNYKWDVLPSLCCKRNVTKKVEN